ncbi:MAG: glycosyltransferase family 39 protein [Ignavibacteria bacterium]|nr:glycosyltransferase family 39 protein [Ignavibacteria bacterium]
MKEFIYLKYKVFYDNVKKYSLKILNSDTLTLSVLILLKILFQFIIISSGYRWLSSDDYCRTVKSLEWMEKPEIISGVWLSPHFWVNGIMMIFVKDLFIAATAVNFIFSALTLVYFYKLTLFVFDKKNAVISSLVFIFFPFQVWLSISGLPESIHFFFIIAGIYYSVLFKKENRKLKHLVIASLMFSFGNMFRYEGWLFSIVFVIFVAYSEILMKRKNKPAYLNFLVSLISLSTIVWWLLQNLSDHGSMFYFAAETRKIFEDYGSIGVLQRVVQYPVFIFYIAPITSLFAIKVVYDCIKGFLKKKTEVTPLSIFAFFNIFQLLLLMMQGLLGTGGTNMISRYIVVNAMLFVPMAVYQIFNYRKWLAVSLFSVIFLGNIVWSFYYPNPFREDTYETGRVIRDRIENNFIKSSEKVYFEEVEGYYDVFAVQTLSNYPSRFVLGNFPVEQKELQKKKKKRKELSTEELNVLDIKSYLEKNDIALAVVKSESYAEKLRKMNFKSEDIGDYKIFYIRGLETSLSDTSILVLTGYVPDLQRNPELVNYNRTLALKDFQIDNSNFGFNPQTVTITWTSATRNIIDSLDYDNYEFERYQSIIEIRREEDDSLVYTERRKIFSDRNIENLISRNEVKNIIVLKPFALIYYSRKYINSPFESGVYNLALKVHDGKEKKDLAIFKGDSLYTVLDKVSDTLKYKLSDSLVTVAKHDTLRVKTKLPGKEKTKIMTSYTLGNIIAFFPDTNIEKVVKSGGTNFYRIITRNGMQVFFSQRYQADHFLNFVFNYF